MCLGGQEDALYCFLCFGNWERLFEGLPLRHEHVFRPGLAAKRDVAAEVIQLTCGKDMAKIEKWQKNSPTNGVVLLFPAPFLALRSPPSSLLPFLPSGAGPKRALGPSWSNSHQGIPIAEPGVQFPCLEEAR